MKGSLEGDFSRRIPDTDKRYSAVYLQQGRVLLDSDWNALMDLLARRLRAETRDLVGPCGGPDPGAGYAIRARPRLVLNGRDRYLTLGGRGFRVLSNGAGFTFEIGLLPYGHDRDQTLLDRFVRRGEGAFERASTLELSAEGRLRLRPAGAGAPALAGADPLAPGRVHHLALVVTREWTALYVDGELAGQAPRSGALEDLDTLFVLGAAADREGASRGFAGEVRTVRLWGVPRRMEDIVGDAGRELAGDEEGLLGVWDFDRPADEVPDRDDRGRRWILGGGRAAHRPDWASGLTIGAGRYYVDGIVCDNPSTVAFDAQPDAPWARLPELREGRLYLAYLDVWERLVTALQDPEIAEVALGPGVDTTVRSRTVGQVRVLEMPASTDPSQSDEECLAAWRQLVEGGGASGRLEARRQPSAEELGNLLYRVEVHRPGGVGGGTSEAGDAVPAAKVEPGRGTARIELEEWTPEVDRWQVGDCLEVTSELAAAAGKGGRTGTITALDRDGRTVELDAGLDDLAGDTGLELRRVATFKWSRENASVVFPIAKIDAGSEMVALENQGQRPLTLEPGDWVEYFDDDLVLRPVSGPLYRVEKVDAVNLRVTLDAAPISDGNAGSHPGLRRWDQKEQSGETLRGGAVVAASGWMALEAGIEVRFTGGGRYRGRDYWQIPARTVTEDIEWPQRAAGKTAVPEALPPQGIAHHYAPLALLHRDASGLEVRDCRKTFRPLVEGAVSKAGDSMYGSLTIRADLVVEGAGEGDPGRVTAGVLDGPLGMAGAVATENLQERSVTADKLAFDVGGVPPGYSILGPGREPPPGYDYTRSALTVFRDAAAWHERKPVPTRDEGPLRAAAARGRLYVFLDSAEVWEYDPARDDWRLRCHRRVPGRDFAVAAAGEKIYVVGGVDASGRRTGAVWEYDPATNGWTAGHDMSTARSHLALAEAGGLLYAMGGLVDTFLGPRATTANEAYDPVTGGPWTACRPLPRALYGAAAASSAGQVHLLGGVHPRLFGRWSEALSARHDEYLPAPSDRWVRGLAPLPTPRADAAATTVEARIELVGGEGLAGPLAEALEYDPAVAGWRRRPDLPVAARPAAAAVAGRLLAVVPDPSPDCPGLPTYELHAAARFYIHRKERVPEDDAGTEPPASGTSPTAGGPAARSLDDALLAGAGTPGAGTPEELFRELGLAGGDEDEETSESETSGGSSAARTRAEGGDGSSSDASSSGGS